MTGLLDALSSDDAKLGIALLSASGYSPTPLSFGQRLGGALGQYNADRQASADRALRLKLLQSQMDENASQNQLRQAQIAKLTADQSFIDGIGKRMNGGGVAASAAGDPSVSVGVTPGVGGIGTPGTGVSGTQQVGPNSFPLSFGEVVQAGLRGHNLMDAFKYANEPQQLQPGSLYRNRMTGQVESIPSVSQNGQASQILPDPTAPGGYRVIAPNGAVDVYKQYKNVDAGTSPGKGTIGANGRMQPTSVAEDLGLVPPRDAQAPLGVRNNNPGNLRPVGASTGFQQFDTPEAGLQALDQNLQAYGKRGINTIEGVVNRWAPSSENNTSAYVKAVSQRLGIPANQPIDLASPYVRQALGTAIMLQENGPGILTRGSQAGAGRGVVNPAPDGTGIGIAGGTDFSPMEKAAQEAEATRLKNTAAADVVRDTTKIADTKRFGQIMATTDRALNLLEQGPTASGFGSLVDAGANFVGKSTKGADIASQLDTLSGWMTANVPRMEGPQSDKDVAQYRIMAAAVGDRTKPVAQRLAAAQELQSLQQKYAELNGLKSSGGATGDWSQEPQKSNLIQELPKTAPMGARVRDTTTGKVLRFNGLQWKEE